MTRLADFPSGPKWSSPGSGIGERSELRRGPSAGGQRHRRGDGGEAGQPGPLGGDLLVLGQVGRRWRSWPPPGRAAAGDPRRAARAARESGERAVVVARGQRFPVARHPTGVHGVRAG
ncbi:hypothetical protein [Crossiella sp. CA198]|uniref:hypothetical protein n=1 Tax=Crossiella sp. CA198 TaxID=3455607 RepID=UPI003F8D7C34